MVTVAPQVLSENELGGGHLSAGRPELMKVVVLATVTSRSREAFTAPPRAWLLEVGVVRMTTVPARTSTSPSKVARTTRPEPGAFSTGFSDVHAATAAMATRTKRFTKTSLRPSGRMLACPPRLGW
jgi:hypothetical protein